MPRVKDIRDRVHQPRYDSLVRAIGTTSVTNGTPLFSSAVVADRGRTNMSVPGQLSSDATFVLKALRGILWFESLNDSEFTAPPGTGITPITPGSPLGSNARAQILYQLMAYGATFTLKIATKEYLQAPFWYIPAGGGISGFTQMGNQHVLSNGVASHEAILKLARDIPIPARQSFSLSVDFFPFLRGNPGLGSGGGALGADVDVLQILNQFDGFKLIQAMIDGLETRDVL
jgi:hypothetical protein